MFEVEEILLVEQGRHFVVELMVYKERTDIRFGLSSRYRTDPRQREYNEREAVVGTDMGFVYYKNVAENLPADLQRDAEKTWKISLLGADIITSHKGR